MSLQLNHITKVFGSGAAAHTAVDDLSLDIERGTFCTLLGPSGCGKTTLLRVIAGFEQPTHGQVLHNGRSLNAVPPHARGFPMVFQSYALFPHMTVFDNIAYGLRVRRIARAPLTGKVQRAAALLGLDQHLGRYPSQLSGGQQQRVALARALVLEPEILLLDEPLSNLDAELRISMRTEIRALQQRLGITAIYVTHDQEEALAISDRIVVLNRGRIEQSGTPADLYQRPGTEFVARFLGSPNIVPVQRVAPGSIMLFAHSYEMTDVPEAATHAVIRSDAIALARTGGRHGATVLTATFLGARVQYTLRLDDGFVLSLEQPASVDTALYETGDRVTFAVMPARLHFLLPHGPPLAKTASQPLPGS